MNILFVCTSNKDRSPALERHFREKYPQHEYRSAGINRHHTQRKGTRLISEEDVRWADIMVFAEFIHSQRVMTQFESSLNAKHPFSIAFILNLGDYDKDNMQQYVLDAEKKILEEFPEVFKGGVKPIEVVDDTSNWKERHAERVRDADEFDKQMFEELKRRERLRKESPRHLLEAAVRHYSKNNPEAEQWMRLGFALAQDNGWENVAPAWLKEEQSEEDTFKFDITKPGYDLQQ